MRKFHWLAILALLWGCGTEPREVVIDLPDELPVVERFQQALEIVSALSDDGFPKHLGDSETSGDPEVITSSDLTISAIANVTDVKLVTKSERVYIVCTIHNQKKADEIEDECLHRVFEQLAR